MFRVMNCASGSCPCPCNQGECENNQVKLLLPAADQGGVKASTCYIVQWLLDEDSRENFSHGSILGIARFLLNYKFFALFFNLTHEKSYKC